MNYTIWQTCMVCAGCSSFCIEESKYGLYSICRPKCALDQTAYALKKQKQKLRHHCHLVYDQWTVKTIEDVDV